MSFPLRLNMSKRATKDKSKGARASRSAGRSNTSVSTELNVEEGAALTLTTSVEPPSKKSKTTKTSEKKGKCFPALAVVLNNVVQGKPETTKKVITMITTRMLLQHAADNLLPKKNESIIMYALHSDSPSLQMAKSWGKVCGVAWEGIGKIFAVLNIIVSTGKHSSNDKTFGEKLMVAVKNQLTRISATVSMLMNESGRLNAAELEIDYDEESVQMPFACHPFCVYNHKTAAPGTKKNMHCMVLLIENCFFKGAHTADASARMFYDTGEATDHPSSWPLRTVEQVTQKITEIHGELAILRNVVVALLGDLHTLEPHVYERIYITMLMAACDPKTVHLFVAEIGRSRHTDESVCKNL